MQIKIGKNPWRELATEAKLECCTSSTSPNAQVEIVLRIKDPANVKNKILLELSPREATNLYASLSFLTGAKPPEARREKREPETEDLEIEIVDL